MIDKKNEMQTTGLQLSKSSTSEQMKAYFSQVFKLKSSGEPFPVDFSMVWPLAYKRKEEAVRTLKRDFIETVDFQALRRNAERGAASPIDYYLSVECLEYFIAKKVKPVFEVYRQVFHKAIAGTVHFNNKNFVTRTEYCEMYGKSVNSFNALLGHYPLEFLFANGVWSISTDLCQKVELENKVKTTRKRLMLRNDPNQYVINFSGKEA